VADQITVTQALSQVEYRPLPSLNAIQLMAQVEYRTSGFIKIIHSLAQVEYRPGVPVTLVSLSISGPSNVNEGSSVAYTAVANWSDLTSSQVVADSWYIGPPSVYATIDNLGIFTAGLVELNQQVTINATYFYNNVTYYASLVVTILDIPVSPTYDQRLLYWETRKILEMLLDNFTPKMRYQYQDSVLFKSYVEAMAEELATNQLQIKQAALQLNFQEAVSIFLNLWTQVIGIKKLEGETDSDYKNRILNNLFIDKVSNNAIRKSLLIKYGFSSAVNDSGAQVANLTYGNFSDKVVKAKLLSNFYELSIDGVSQPPIILDMLYEDSMLLTALGNIIMRVVQDVNQGLIDGPNLFGAIYFQHDATGESAIDRGTETNLGIGQSFYVDNQYNCSLGLLFDRNLYVDDLVIFLRTD